MKLILRVSAARGSSQINRAAPVPILRAAEPRVGER